MLVTDGDAQTTELINRACAYDACNYPARSSAEVAHKSLNNATDAKLEVAVNEIYL